MWRDDGTCLGQSGDAASGQREAWLAIGSDYIWLERQAAALARFGISVRMSEAVQVPSPITSVLCDGRSRALVRGLIDQAPARLAPTVILGVNTARERARLILAGMDDAVSARIAPSELAARMKAAQRSRAVPLGIIRLAGFTFDTGLRHVCWQGKVVPLMPREFDLLLVLARHAGLPVGRDALLKSVWRTAFDPGTNSPEVHVFKLRQRLAALGGAVRIETVKRQGYRLVSDPAVLA